MRAIFDLLFASLCAGLRPGRVGACAIGCLSSLPAAAGGGILPVHGVRSLARAGAFIAGADDADALWLNPAGIAHAAGDGKRALLFDIALVYQPVDYTAADGTPASNQQPSQPVPALAGSLGIGDRLVIGGGISTPYATLHRYTTDGPARFASLSTTGTTRVLVSVGAAYRVSDRLRVGATIQDQFTKLSHEIVMSGCPPTMTCAADDRSFDMQAGIAETDYFSPSGSMGLQYDASEKLTLGLAVQAPMRVSANGTLTPKLPSSLFYEDATVTGDAVSVAYTLPAAVRAGAELRPLPGLRLELALAVELWSMQDEITIEPDGISITTAGGERFPFRAMTIERELDTTFAPSLGVEYHAARWMIGGGYAYENGAVPASHLSVLAVDASKHLLAIGGGYDEDGWQIGGAIAYTIYGDVTVGDPAIRELEPLGAQQDVRVNGGTYETSSVVAGLRFARRW